MNTHFKLVSENGKTGPIPVSVTSKAACAKACPFIDSGCYAKYSFLNMHWQKVTSGERGEAWPEFVARVAKIARGQLWRHNAAGDLQGDGVTIDAAKLAELAKANKGKRGFTYTHYLPSAANLKAIRAAVAAGFTINLSANSPRHADELHKLGLPVACVVPASVDGSKTKTMTTPGGNVIVICPATYKAENEPGGSCARCGLCQVATRKTIIGFPAHGSGKAAVSKIASA